MTATRTYRLWAMMKHRHLSAICNEWLDFENFHKDMGDAPIGASIKRVSLSKRYSKANCKWVAASKAKVVATFTAHGATGTVEQWAEHSGLHKQTILNRRAAGHTDEQCVTNYGTPINRVLFYKDKDD